MCASVEMWLKRFMEKFFSESASLELIENDSDTCAQKFFNRPSLPLALVTLYILKCGRYDSSRFKFF